MNRYLAGGLGLLAFAVASSAADAMPAQNVMAAVTASDVGTSMVEKAFVVCGPFRCFHRGWGWRRPYYGWHRAWGWHRWRRW